MKRFISVLALLPLVAFTHPGEPTHTKQPNIVELASQAGTFETLLAAAKAAGLAETLAKGGPFTVLAPTDDAFAKLPQDAVAALLKPENKEKLAEVLTLHVISGEVDAATAIQAKSAKALSGGSLNFAIDGGRLKVNEATVIANDLKAANGVVHVIDTVLAPETGFAPAPIGRLVIGVYTGRPSADLCAQLSIDRHKSLLIKSVSKGTAQEAGIMQYDVVTSVDGKPASDAELKRAKERAGFGQTIELELIRKGERFTQHVKVGAERH